MRTKCRSRRSPRRYRWVPTADSMVGFRAERVGSGDIVCVVARADAPFRGHRLAYAGPSGTFVLRNIFVNRKGQIAGPMQVPMELFPPLPPDLAGVSPWLNNCGVHDWADAGSEIILVIQNVSGAPADFNAAMFGEAAFPL